MCLLFREGCHQKSPSRGYIPLVWGKLVHPLKGYLVFYSTPRRAPYGYIPHIIGDVFWPPPPLPIVGSLLILESNTIKQRSDGKILQRVVISNL